jgi:hypothetical protein
LVLRNLDTRLTKLEDGTKKSTLKKITENTGAIALFLGLVLSFASLYDVLVTKPEAERINTLSQFNRAVSSAAQIRQDLLQTQGMVKDQSVLLAIQSAAAPRIMNEIATARALLRDMRDADVGIPQLIILISEAMNAGDPAAGDFVNRAVKKKDVPPFLQSEAKRFQAKYLFFMAQPAEGRKAMTEALALLPQGIYANSARAFDVSDWISLEFVNGDCVVAESELDELGKILRQPGVSALQRLQIVGGLVGSLQQYQGQHCPLPNNMGTLGSL